MPYGGFVCHIHSPAQSCRRRRSWRWRCGGRYYPGREAGDFDNEIQDEYVSSLVYVVGGKQPTVLGYLLVVSIFLMSILGSAASKKR